VKIIVGLGNPGERYARTRHNVGFRVVDEIAARWRLTEWQEKYDALVGDWRRRDERVLLVKPQTHMNLSGGAVRRIFRYLPATAADLVVVYDDLDLPFGRIRVRSKGGAAGHRGVVSIMQAVGRDDFLRVRVGIGRPPPGIEATDFVLASFSPSERGELAGVLAKAATAVECLLDEGPQRAMENFNRAD
jgi:PTH1 family peptidyl-tRNA hydrolase